MVYIGIRIIISSTGQEKAKYKKMIGDWLAAICILFVLHYIMAITMTVVENILSIFNIENIFGSMFGEDKFMSEIRQNINTSKAFSEQFADLIIYLVLVIYTVVFTIHYLKRLVYLAFFTMIAPLIALTYPLDKIKDGQAQAFGMWIKEYIFNALIPVMHMLLYYIFVGGVPELAKNNPIYALVCIGFLIPAEKFFKKMFGFDKATTSGQLGAAAGGALVMNAINKIGSAGKGEEKKAEKTPKPTGINGADWGGPNSGGNATQGPSTSNSNPTLTSQNNTSAPTPPPTTQSGPNTQSNNPFTMNLNKNNTGKAPGIGKGISSALSDRFNKPAIKGVMKKGGKKLYRGAGKVLGGAALGTVGLAAGIATGDLSNVAKFAGAGALAGAKLGDKAAGKIAASGKRTKDAFLKGALGNDEFATREAIKQLNNDNDFLKACKSCGINNGKDIDSAVRLFMDNGITDTDDIKQSLIAAKKLQEAGGRRLTQDQMVQLAITANGISNNQWTDSNSRDDFLNKMYANISNSGSPTPYDDVNDIKKFIDFYKNR